MTKRLVINVGFVTNSSSVVYHFPKALWEHPRVQALARAYGIDKEGYIGSVWYRSDCESVAVSREEKEALRSAFMDNEYGTPPGIDVDNEGPIVVYGDEYDGLAQTLVSLASSLHQEDPSLPDLVGEDFH